MNGRWKGRSTGGKEMGQCLQAHLCPFLSIIHFLELHPWEGIQSLLFEISKCTRHEGVLFVTTSFTFLNSISSLGFRRISSQSKQSLVGLSGNLLWQTEWFNKVDIYEEEPPLLNRSVNQMNTTHLKPLHSQYFVTGKRETQVLKMSLWICTQSLIKFYQFLETSGWILYKQEQTWVYNYLHQMRAHSRSQQTPHTSSLSTGCSQYPFSYLFPTYPPVCTLFFQSSEPTYNPECFKCLPQCNWEALGSLRGVPIVTHGMCIDLGTENRAQGADTGRGIHWLWENPLFLIHSCTSSTKKCLFLVLRQK